MQKITNILMVLALCITINIKNTDAQPVVTIFSDHFDYGTRVSNSLWHIPTWVSPTDGTFIGRTQFRCSQNSPLPLITNSNAHIDLDTHNPTGYSPYGTDLISNRTFRPGPKGIDIYVYIKILDPTNRGIVFAAFLYDLKTGSNTLHDEIDYEILTNDLNKIHTNIYNNEPLGTGHPDSVNVAPPVTSYHLLKIEWRSTGVKWLIDGAEVKSSSVSPSGPMHFHLNTWAPAIEWRAAYDASLQPVSSVSLNKTYSMLVDYVRVDSLSDVLTYVKKNVEKPSVSFYPNPAHDQITFTDSGGMNVIIYNMLSVVMINQRIVNGSLSVTTLSRGFYLIRFQKNGIFYTKKLIIE